ncbi:hypothetical protein PCE1_001738 [Barthelona sp. PCE]
MDIFDNPPLTRLGREFKVQFKALRNFISQSSTDSSISSIFKVFEQLIRQFAPLCDAVAIFRIVNPAIRYLFDNNYLIEAFVIFLEPLFDRILPGSSIPKAIMSDYEMQRQYFALMADLELQYYRALYSKAVTQDPLLLLPDCWQTFERIITGVFVMLQRTTANDKATHVILNALIFLVEMSHRLSVQKPELAAHIVNSCLTAYESTPPLLQTHHCPDLIRLLKAGIPVSSAESKFSDRMLGLLNATKQLYLDNTQETIAEEYDTFIREAEKLNVFEKTLHDEKSNLEILDFNDLLNLLIPIAMNLIMDDTKQYNSVEVEAVRALKIPPTVLPKAEEGEEEEEEEEKNIFDEFRLSLILLTKPQGEAAKKSDGKSTKRSSNSNSTANFDQFARFESQSNVFKCLKAVHTFKFVDCDSFIDIHHAFLTLLNAIDSPITKIIYNSLLSNMIDSFKALGDAIEPEFLDLCLEILSEIDDNLDITRLSDQRVGIVPIVCGVSIGIDVEQYLMICRKVLELKSETDKEVVKEFLDKNILPLVTKVHELGLHDEYFKKGVAVTSISAEKTCGTATMLADWTLFSERIRYLLHLDSLNEHLLQDHRKKLEQTSFVSTRADIYGGKTKMIKKPKRVKKAYDTDYETQRILDVQDNTYMMALCYILFAEFATSGERATMLLTQALREIAKCEVEEKLLLKRVESDRELDVRVLLRCSSKVIFNVKLPEWVDDYRAVAQSGSSVTINSTRIRGTGLLTKKGVASTLSFKPSDKINMISVGVVLPDESVIRHPPFVLASSFPLCTLYSQLIRTSYVRNLDLMTLCALSECLPLHMSAIPTLPPVSLQGVLDLHLTTNELSEEGAKTVGHILLVAAKTIRDISQRSKIESEEAQLLKLFSKSINCFGWVSKCLELTPKKRTYVQCLAASCALTAAQCFLTDHLHSIFGFDNVISALCVFYEFFKPFVCETSQMPGLMELLKRANFILQHITEIEDRDKQAIIIDLCCDLGRKGLLTSVPFIDSVTDLDLKLELLNATCLSNLESPEGLLPLQKIKDFGTLKTEINSTFSKLGPWSAETNEDFIRCFQTTTRYLEICLELNSPIISSYMRGSIVQITSAVPKLDALAAACDTVHAQFNSAQKSYSELMSSFYAVLESGGEGTTSDTPKDSKKGKKKGKKPAAVEEEEPEDESMSKEEREAASVIINRLPVLHNISQLKKAFGALLTRVTTYYTTCRCIQALCMVADRLFDARDEPEPESAKGKKGSKSAKGKKSKRDRVEKREEKTKDKDSDTTSLGSILLCRSLNSAIRLYNDTGFSSALSQIPEIFGLLKGVLEAEMVSFTDDNYIALMMSMGSLASVVEKMTPTVQLNMITFVSTVSEIVMSVDPITVAVELERWVEAIPTDSSLQILVDRWNDALNLIEEDDERFQQSMALANEMKALLEECSTGLEAQIMQARILSNDVLDSEEILRLKQLYDGLLMEVSEANDSLQRLTLCNDYSVFCHKWMTQFGDDTLEYELLRYLLDFYFMRINSTVNYSGISFKKLKKRLAMATLQQLEEELWMLWFVVCSLARIAMRSDSAHELIGISCLSFGVVFNFITPIASMTFPQSATAHMLTELTGDVLFPQEIMTLNLFPSNIIPSPWLVTESLTALALLNNDRYMLFTPDTPRALSVSQFAVWFARQVVLSPNEILYASLINIQCLLRLGYLSHAAVALAGLGNVDIGIKAGESLHNIDLKTVFGMSFGGTPFFSVLSRYVHAELCVRLALALNCTDMSDDVFSLLRGLPYYSMPSEEAEEDESKVEEAEEEKEDIFGGVQLYKLSLVVHYAMRTHMYAECIELLGQIMYPTEATEPVKVDKAKPDKAKAKKKVTPSSSRVIVEGSLLSSVVNEGYVDIDETWKSDLKYIGRWRPFKTLVLNVKYALLESMRAVNHDQYLEYYDVFVADCEAASFTELKLLALSSKVQYQLHRGFDISSDDIDKLLCLENNEICVHTCVECVSTHARVIMASSDPDTLQISNNLKELFGLCTNAARKLGTSFGQSQSAYHQFENGNCVFLPLMLRIQELLLQYNLPFDFTVTPTYSAMLTTNSMPDAHRAQVYFCLSLSLVSNGTPEALQQAHHAIQQGIQYAVDSVSLLSNDFYKYVVLYVQIACMLDDKETKIRAVAFRALVSEAKRKFFSALHSDVGTLSFDVPLKWLDDIKAMHDAHMLREFFISMPVNSNIYDHRIEYLHKSLMKSDSYSDCISVLSTSFADRSVGVVTTYQDYEKQKLHYTLLIKHQLWYVYDCAITAKSLRYLYTHSDELVIDGETPTVNVEMFKEVIFKLFGITAEDFETLQMEPTPELCVELKTLLVEEGAIQDKPGILTFLLKSVFKNEFDESHGYPSESGAKKPGKGGKSTRGSKRK